MTSPTQEQLDDLARFVGLKLQNEPKLWYGVDNNNLSIVISYHEWNPFTNPAHADLVLRALVKNEGWFYWLKRLASDAFGNEKDFDLPEAICLAALVVIKQKGESDGI